MALIQKKISKSKQLRLVIALSLVIGITASVAYFGLFKKPSAPKDQDDLFAVQARDSVDAVPEKSAFELIDDLSENSLFKKLKSFGTWPLPKEPKGKSQPFIQKQEKE